MEEVNKQANNQPCELMSRVMSPSCLLHFYASRLIRPKYNLVQLCFTCHVIFAPLNQILWKCHLFPLGTCVAITISICLTILAPSNSTKFKQRQSPLPGSYNACCYIRSFFNYTSKVLKHSSLLIQLFHLLPSDTHFDQR